MNPATSLLTLWRLLAVPEAAPASMEQIAVFESRYGVRIPTDFRAYIVVTNGMADTETITWDDEGVRFWGLPLSDEQFEKDFDYICPASRAWPQCRQPEADRLFVFADWCIGVSDFAIDFLPDSPTYGQVFRLSDDTPVLIYPSFTDFVNSYVVSRDAVILGCEEEAFKP